MKLEKPELEVVLFDKNDTIVTSGPLCSWDCQNQTCSNVCTGNQCPPVYCPDDFL